MKKVVIDGIQYELDCKTGTATVIPLADGNRYAGMISIPVFIKHKPFFSDEKVYLVNNIHSNAFANSNIISIVIPDGVTCIENRSFEGCSSLKTINFPKGLECIGSYAFNGCTQLTSIKLPHTLTVLSKGAFRNCESLTNIVIPNNVTRIEENAFENCSSLTSINIPQHIAFVGMNSFQGCTSITTIIWDAIQYNGIKEEFIRIPKKIDVNFERIMREHDPFYRSAPYTTKRELISPFNSIIKQIESFVFGDNVKHIPNFICEEMRNLRHISFGKNIESVGKDAFNCCPSRESIFWNVKEKEGSVNKELFDSCIGRWSLKELSFGDQIIDIPNGLCERISTLNSVSFGSNIKSVGYNSFEGTEWLKNHNAEDIYINRYLYKAYLPEGVSVYTISEYTLDILSGAFSNCKSLKSIIIPNSITTIGPKAFLGCSTLEMISIPDSVTSIGDGAFSYCKSLTSIVIPDSVTSIGDGAFSDCKSLTSIVIPNSVTSIGNSAFCACFGLSSITIPKSVTNIGEGAFSGCPNLVSVAVECGNLTYDSRNNCNAIIKTDTNTLINGCQDTIIPNSVTTIGPKAFLGCSSLRSITIPHSITCIDSYAFSHCSQLTSITIPNSVTSIGRSVFSMCYSLSSITIPNSVMSIGEIAFAGCVFAKDNFVNNSSCTSEDNFGAKLYDEDIDGLLINNHQIQHARYSVLRGNKSITIPSTITSITKNVFSERRVLTFHNLTTIIWDAVECEPCHWEEEECIGKQCDKYKKVSYYGPFAKIAHQITSFEFGPNVRHIPEHLCEGMKNLTSIVIPNNVKKISEAFRGCSSLKTISIPHNIVCDSWRGQNIRNSLFISPFFLVKEANITTVSVEIYCKDPLPEQSKGYRSSGRIPTVIPGCDPNRHLMVNGIEITKIEIPSTICHLKDHTFYHFSNITSVTLPKSISKIGKEVFWGTSINEAVFLGNIEDWCKILFEDEYSNPISISHNLFIDQQEVIDLNIPSSITRINDYAFSYCESLKTILFPSTITEIGNLAFIGCINLQEVYIPGSVTKIGSNAFKNCTSLATAHIPYSIQEIGQGVFAGCRTLNKVIIPESVTKIDWQAFSGCKSLSSLSIPNSVIFIGSRAFEDCSLLTTINIPEQIQEIESYTFAGCSMLYSINIPNGVTSIKSAAFKNCTSLTNLTLPTTITSIATDAFENCSSLEKILVPAGQKVRFVQMGLGVYEHLIQEQEDDKTIALLKLADAHAFAKDFLQATIYYTQAAEKGNAEAAYQLAEWYAKGENLTKDAHKALQYYQQAAKISYRDAHLKAEQLQREIEAEQQRYNEQMAAFMDEQVMSYAQQTIPEEIQSAYLFFDTECNGLPQFYDMDVRMTNNWPNVIQLAWIVTDEQGNVLKRKSHIITPEGFEINDNVAALTGITTSRAMREGIELTTALSDFMSDINNAQLLIGHNIDFDMKVVGCELYRNGMDYESLLSKKTLCTMKRSTYFCAIPNPRGKFNDYKWPKLEELYRKLFNRPLTNAHDALADITATKECYFELRRLGVI